MFLYSDNILFAFYLMFLLFIFNLIMTYGVFVCVFLIFGHKKTLNIGLYSLPGGSSWNRTNDTRIFSPVLYRLSYEATK